MPRTKRDTTIKSNGAPLGFEEKLWAAAHLIEREFGVTYHAHSLSDVLADLGGSLQHPLARAQERDEEVIQAWLAQDWPRIKKARQRGVDIVFFDEFGSTFLARLWRT